MRLSEVIDGRSVLLRLPQPNDAEDLESLLTTPSIHARWRLRSTSARPGTASASLNDSQLTKLIVDVKGNEVAGFATLFNVDWSMGFGFLGIVVKERYQGSSIAGQGLVLFLEDVFDRWPLRKLYAEVPAYNAPTISSATRRLAKREAVIRNREEYGSRLWDVEIWAIYREDFLGRLANLATLRR